MKGDSALPCRGPPPIEGFLLARIAVDRKVFLTQPVFSKGEGKAGHLGCHTNGQAISPPCHRGGTRFEELFPLTVAAAAHCTKRVGDRPNKCRVICMASLPCWMKKLAHGGQRHLFTENGHNEMKPPRNIPVQGCLSSPLRLVAPHQPRRYLRQDRSCQDMNGFGNNRITPRFRTALFWTSPQGEGDPASLLCTLHGASSLILPTGLKIPDSYTGSCRQGTQRERCKSSGILLCYTAGW